MTASELDSLATEVTALGVRMVEAGTAYEKGFISAEEYRSLIQQFEKAIAFVKNESEKYDKEHEQRAQKKKE